MYVENRTKIANFPTPRVLNAPLKGFPLEFCIGAGVSENYNDGAFRWLKKFSDRFSGFDTIPECDSQPATQPPSHVAVAITLNAKASSLRRLATANRSCVSICLGQRLTKSISICIGCHRKLS